VAIGLPLLVLVAVFAARRGHRKQDEADEDREGATP
jgi:hypothetical protein